MKLFFFMLVILAFVANAQAQIIAVSSHNTTETEQRNYNNSSSKMAKEIVQIQQLIVGLDIQEADLLANAIGYQLITKGGQVIIRSKIDNNLKLVGVLISNDVLSIVVSNTTITVSTVPTVSTEILIPVLVFAVGDSLEYFEVIEKYLNTNIQLSISVDTKEHNRRGITSKEVQKEINRLKRKAAIQISTGFKIWQFSLSSWLLPYNWNFRACSDSSLTGERTLFGATVGNLLDGIVLPVNLVGYILYKTGKQKKQDLARPQQEFDKLVLVKE